jgi:hypothetical protein
MKLLLLLIFTALPLIAQGIRHVQVRVVTFEKSGAATALDAAQPDCDESLYASLTADTAAGTAQRVHDQTMSVRGGQRAKVEALHEFAFPAENEAEATDWFIYPTSFTSQSLGHTLEAEVTVGELIPGWPQQPLDINLAPESGSLLAMHPWPVPDFRGSGQMGRTVQPVMSKHWVTTQALTWTGRTLLLSVMPSPASSLSEEAEPAFLYTFLRAGLDGEKPAPVTSTPPHVVNQRRLHAVTIRLPREEAAALLLSSSGDDAALYNRLRDMVAEGAAELCDYSAALCRGGQRSMAESRAQFHFPSNFTELIPEGWSVLNPGSRLETEYEGSRDWELALQRAEAPDMEPFHPSAKHPALFGAQPSWVERQFQTSLNIPSSGVLCAAAVSTSPATDDESVPDGTSDLTFLLQSRPPGIQTASAPTQTFLQAAIFSMPVKEGASLKPGDTAAPLLARFSAREIACPAHAGISLPGSYRGKVECQRHVPHPMEFQPSIVNAEVSLPSGWEHWQCGLALHAEYGLEAKSIIMNGTFEWDTAPAESLGEPGVKVPEDFHDRRCQQQIKLDNIRLTPGQPVIADVRASNAREGTREHGRWHVLVMLVR